MHIQTGCARERFGIYTFTPLTRLCRPPSPPHTCTHFWSHVQNGRTALILACRNKHESAASELIEPTRRAGALDLQVAHEAWFGGCGVRGAVEERGSGRGKGGRAEEGGGRRGGNGRGLGGGGRGVQDIKVLTCACAGLSTGQ